VNKFILYIFIFFSSTNLTSQDVNDIRISNLGQNTRLDAIITDDQFAYVMGTSIDTIFPYFRIGTFYKIDLSNSSLVDSIRLVMKNGENDSKSNEFKIVGDREGSF